MRIAYISPFYKPHFGGVETHVEQIATRAAAAGHQVEILTQENNRNLPAVEIIAGVTVRRFLVPVPSEHFAFAPGLWAYLARHSRDYDIVHAHGYHNLPVLGAALSLSQRLIFTPHYHGTGHSPLRRLLHVPYRPIGAWIFARSQHIICVSEAEAILVRRHFPHVATRISILHNGVDTTLISQAQPYATDHTIVLSAGRLEEYKNVQLTVNALAHLDQTFELRVTGDGPARQSIEKLIIELELQKRVELLGRVDVTALHCWFRTAAVYVSMSSNEANPITVLELLCAGAGIVVSDIPAHREIAREVGEDAMTLVPIDITPERLACVVRDTAERRAQGALSVPKIASWDAVTTQTIDIYRKSLDLVQTRASGLSKL